MTPLGVMRPHLGEEALGMRYVGVLCSHLEEEEEPGMKQVGVLCSHSEKLGTRFPGFLW
jgi:hypothetical protein